MRLAGPLPPMDIDAANEAMKEIYADWVRAVSSTDAEWWERSTAQNWLRYVNTASEYGIPVSLETLQFFRATLLYNSIIMRLDKDIDPVREFTVYAQGAAEDARRRVRKSARKRLNGSTRGMLYVLNNLPSAATQFALKLQRSVEDPITHFRTITGKIATHFLCCCGLSIWGSLLWGLASLSTSSRRSGLIGVFRGMPSWNP